MNTTTDSFGLRVPTAVVPDSGVIPRLLLADHCGCEPGELETIEEIHVRAETMTSLLKGILDFHPRTHWSSDN